MEFDVLVALALLALVIGVSTLFKGIRKLCEAECLAMKVRRELADCEQARRELQEFTMLFNYGVAIRGNLRSSTSVSLAILIATWWSNPGLVQPEVSLPQTARGGTDA